MLRQIMGLPANIHRDLRANWPHRLKRSKHQHKMDLALPFIHLASNSRRRKLRHSRKNALGSTRATSHSYWSAYIKPKLKHNHKTVWA